MTVLKINFAKPKNDGQRNKKVAICAYDGLCTFEFGITVEIFCLPRPELEDWYTAQVCAIEEGPLHAMGGITVQAEAGLNEIAEAGTIVIPGWRGIDEPVPQDLVMALSAAHHRGARLVSICSGVFVLAATGLLDGLEVTTHWRYADALARAYPEIIVNADVLYVDQGQILTSAGSAAGMDLCLHIVRRDYGAVIANYVAKRLVVSPHRNGGQAQFIESPIQDRQSKMASLLEWAKANLHADIKVSRMAEKAGMSQRTFERRFFAATGTPPAEWLTQRRLDYAKQLLESDDASVENVATRSGFGSADTLRHHFRTRFQISPLQYRRNFRCHRV